MFFFFFSPSDIILVFVFFVGYLGLKRPHIFGEKTAKKHIRRSLGKGTLNTCAKLQGLTLKNGVDIWPFVRLRAKITAWHCNLVLEYIRFWALHLTWYWSCEVFFFFCAKLWSNMPRSTWKRLVQKKNGSFFSSYIKCSSIFGLFEGP